MSDAFDWSAAAAYQTEFCHVQLNGADALIEKIIADNLQSAKPSILPALDDIQIFND